MRFDFECSRIVFSAEISILYRLFKLFLVLVMVFIIKKKVVDAAVGGGGIYSFFIAIILAYSISTVIWSMTFFLSIIPFSRKKVIEYRDGFLFFYLEKEYSISLRDINGIDFDLRHPLFFFMKNKINIRTNEKDLVIKTTFNYIPFYNHLDSLRDYFAKGSEGM